MASKFDWDAIRLVVFDVDGTLYDQRALRLRMLCELIGNAISKRSLLTMKVLRTYRRLREVLGHEEVVCFEDLLVQRTAAATGLGNEEVRAIVADWIETRPLAHLRACRYHHVDELFAALKRRGKTIGIFSDYPAAEKLRAMELQSDHIAAAGDANIGILKPHPRGLEVLMAEAGIGPAETILIGDRPEKDGEAARRAGVAVLIRSDSPQRGWPTFSRFSDPVFAPLLARR